MTLTQIYLITNTYNNKKYVGFTQIGLQKRWAKHLKDSQNPKYPVHRAISKYGADKFTMVSIYESFNKDHISAMEEHFIQEFDSRNNGYNVALGGRGGYLGPESTRKRLETRANWSSEEKLNHSLNCSRLAREVQNRPDIKAANSNRMKGNQFARGYHHTEETKSRVAQKLTGIPRPADTKSAIAKTAKQNNAGQRFNIRTSCLCCKREWDIGNYTQHIKRGIKK